MGREDSTAGLRGSCGIFNSGRYPIEHRNTYLRHMKAGTAIILGTLCFSCNPTPPGQKSDYAGLYYPKEKYPKIDSSEILRVTYLDSNAFELNVSGNAGIGKLDSGIISGQLKGSKIGTTPFTFVKSGKKTYEFRAFGSKVDLVKLPAVK
jgi:hypothetical protein